MEESGALELIVSQVLYKTSGVAAAFAEELLFFACLAGRVGADSD